MAWKLGISTKSGTEAAFEAIDVCDYFNTNEECSGSISGLNMNQENQYMKLKKSVINGDLLLVESIINSQNDNKGSINMAAEEGSTLLFLACQSGHKDIVELLFKAGADGMTASCSCLIAAINGGHIDVVLCILKSVPELIQHSTLEHWTPLHAACINGHIDIVKLLLFYDYPDHILKSYRRDFDDDIWECRLAFDPNTQDVTGQTSLYVSCLLGNPSLISILLSWKIRYVKVSATDTDGDTERFYCPFELNKLCGAPRETALLASVRGGYIDVVRLLLQNGADPNTYSKPIDDQSVSELSNSPIAEATRQKFYEIIEILLEHGACDSSNTALSIAVANNDDYILGRLLSVSCYADPEFKINKKKMNNAFESNIGRKFDSNVTYSNLYPINGVIVNWHFSSCQLAYIKESWLIGAAKHCNPNLMVAPSMKNNAFGAITRIDVSHNSLTAIPTEIFYLCSLRYLNLSQNKLEILPQDDSFDCPFLEEIYLQNNKLEEIPAKYFLFPALKTMDVSNNKIQKLPKEMWKALKLRDLNVAFNLLRNFPLNDHEPTSPLEQQRPTLFNEIESLNGIRKQNLLKLEMKHHPIWIDNLEITENDLIFSDLNCGQGQLTNLNIANNLFTSIPASLPCLAPNLTRLNISYNSLRTMGYVTSYPASLRQLDLSHNEITCWPSLPSGRLSSSDPQLLCYNIDGSRSLISNHSSSNSISSKSDDVEDISRSLRNVVLKSVCQHRKHLRLESLRTLILSDNSLSRIQLTTDDVELTDTDENDWNIVGTSKVRLMFPNLSMLDISNNCLKEVPFNLYELNNLSVLNISGNIDITDLPANMGLLSRLWNLNTKGCSIQGPLHSMIESGKYKTMDIIGYLKSIFEDAKAYARMKLMVVGVQGIGKTSLLELLRQESNIKNRKSSDHWTRRMGNSTSKSDKYSNISTVGVDISDWICEKKVKGSSQHGTVVFRTWDFGGQKEYYTTHQYFLSKRSLYLVVWRISDGRQGLSAILQWLSNIQARAPNSPVIIVGTHYDEIGVSISVEESMKLQQTIRERFIVVMDSEKLGLPKVLDSIEVSCKTKYNITVLANLIYDVAFSLRLPGSKELMLYQKVPSTYLALEDVISNICYQFKSSGTDPVLNFESYKQLVTQEMLANNYKSFRDTEELNQATMFLHDNGVILHYDDATLRDLYFLDPQWLCDILAHVVTIREINPFARNGLMKIDDLQHIFKSSSAITKNQFSYIVTLLNKFEVALSWDSRTLLIPSLLPEIEKSSNEVIIKVFQKSFQQSYSQASPSENSISYSIYFESQEKSITRLLLMSYFPSGFWSRLITRILADDQIVNAIGKIYSVQRNKHSTIDQIYKFIDVKWKLWQTGIALFFQDNLIFKLREIPMQCEYSIFRHSDINFALKHDDNWGAISISKSCLMEIYFPINSLCIDAINEHGQTVDRTKLESSIQFLTQILSICVDHIDILLEDWYPTLGTRFVHTSEGRFLVTRLIPCPKCFNAASNSSCVQSSDQNIPNKKLYLWMMEECILALYEQNFLDCPLHGKSIICAIAPDIMFLDLDDDYLLKNEDIVKGPLIGRGAFGFVFKATYTKPISNNSEHVAMKMLQPSGQVYQNLISKTDIFAYKAVLARWKRDPLQHSCKAYCMARQELAVILMLKHPNIVSLVGICVQPLALVLEWAPKGALNEVIREFRRNGAKIGIYAMQNVILQTSRAIEYLHRNHIVYRDLKGENVLVWSFPLPHQQDLPSNKINIKIADYGISRVTLPSGIKGFGGTEGFMAPEIMKHNGEEEYTEKVDCFSFGMYLYELIALRQPFEGHEAVKECILEGGRPLLSRRETYFPCNYLDLMVLCWDQFPKVRPSASQIVSIASAPEFPHLIDVVSLTHDNDLLAIPGNIENLNDNCGFEIWLANSHHRVELLSSRNQRWVCHQRITSHQSSVAKLTAICKVGNAIWIGDSNAVIHAYCCTNYTHIFSYALETNTKNTVTALVNMEKIHRVAATLENGRIFILDSTLIPLSSIFGEGSFVLSELGASGSMLHSSCVIWSSDEDTECELWCGLSDANINVFSIKQSVVLECKTLCHFELSNDTFVSLLDATDNSVYSSVSPGSTLYQWNIKTKTIKNRLDCSKLVPCSESLWSISIEENLSPGKCQISALCVFNMFLYIGTSWGCIIVTEQETLRPVTIFRPFEEHVMSILPIQNDKDGIPLIATFGRGYRPLLSRFTDGNYQFQFLEPNYATHAMLWRADNWIPG